MAENSDSQRSQSQTLKAEAYAILIKYPSIKPKALCKLMDLDYQKYRDYITHKRSEFLSDLKSSQGLKRLSFHKPHGWIYALKGMDREEAVRQGWVQTRAKNRYLLWRDPKGLGRLEWHLQGRINIIMKKPVSEGRLLQLLANGFCWTKLIPDVRVFEAWAKTARFKGYSVTIDTGIRLPYVQCNLFRESNGFGLTMGNKSHPTCIHFDIFYPDWAEKNELMFQQNQKAYDQFTKFLQDLSAPKGSPSKDRSMIV